MIEQDVKILRGSDENKYFGHINCIGQINKSVNLVEQIFNNNDINVGSNIFKKYLNIDRYYFSNDDILNSNVNCDFPTLSYSLSYADNNFFDNKIKLFSTKYFHTQLRGILCFKTVFPLGGVKIYFDKMMIDKFNETTYTNESVPIDITLNDKEKPNELIVPNNLANTEYDNEHKMILSVVFAKFCDEIKIRKIDEIKNTKIKFLKCYDLAMRLKITMFQNIPIVLFDNFPGEFFVVEFFGPFIEYYDRSVVKDSNDIAKSKYEKTNKQTKYKCFLTKGYIFQQVRFIIIGQSNYFLKDLFGNKKFINRSKHIVWRDGHANSTGFADFEYISNFNESCKKNKIKKFLLPMSNTYEVDWHKMLKCDSVGVQKSAIAGQIQFCDFSNDIDALPLNIYLNIFGKPFLITYDDDIYYKNIRNIDIENKILNNYEWDNKENIEKYKNYGYGIDEYTLSDLFINEYIIEHSIYFNFHFINNLIGYNYLNTSNGFIINPINVASIILTYIYIMTHGMYDGPIKLLDVIEFINEMKTNEELFDKYVSMFYQIMNSYSAISKSDNFEALKNAIYNIVNIFPSKYNIVEMIYLNEGPVLFHKRIYPSWVYKILYSIVNKNNVIFNYNKNNDEFIKYADDNMDKKKITESFDIAKIICDTIYNKNDLIINCNGLVQYYPLNWCERGYLINSNKKECENKFNKIKPLEYLYNNGLLLSPYDIDDIINGSKKSVPFLSLQFGGNYDNKSYKLKKIGKVKKNIMVKYLNTPNQNNDEYKNMNYMQNKYQYNDKYNFEIYENLQKICESIEKTQDKLSIPDILENIKKYGIAVYSKKIFNKRQNKIINEILMSSINKVKKINDVTKNLLNIQ